MILRLAMKDLRHDYGAFMGLSVALAAVLAPLLLLSSLKTGITGALLDELRSNPRTLQLQFLNDKTISPAMFDEIAALPGVGFIAPLGRQIAETIEISTEDLRSEAATLQSSGQGDPLLGDLASPTLTETIVSRTLANRLEIEAGQSITLILSNRRTGAEFDINVVVKGVSDQLSGRFVLAHPDLTLAVQSVAAGTAVPAFDIPGNDPISETPDITRLRLYAKGLADVAPLAEELERRGFVIGSEGERIAGILELERNLNWLLSAIVLLAGLGYSLALSVSLWVNVHRKRKSLAMLRLMGLKTRDMVLFPLIQAGSVATLGTLLAIAVTLGIGVVINARFDGSLPAGADIAQVTFAQAAFVFAATAAASIFSGSFGGFAISRLEPKEALRDA